jgi:hypothetical protein
MSLPAGISWGPGRVVFRRYAFAWAYLGCYLAAELVWVLLTPRAQATLTAWASTSVANLEHEPVGPLVLSAFVMPGSLRLWPVLIALAVFGASQGLGNARTTLVCAAGHVVGSLVSEGIVAYRVDAGQLPAGDRYLTDVGPSYVVPWPTSRDCSPKSASTSRPRPSHDRSPVHTHGREPWPTWRGSGGIRAAPAGRGHGSASRGGCTFDHRSSPAGAGLGRCRKSDRRSWAVPAGRGHRPVDYRPGVAGTGSPKSFEAWVS